MTLQTACSRYALLIPDAERENGQSTVRIPENYQSAEIKISRWLRLRGRLEKIVRPKADSSRIYFITSWARDFSLRFFYLDLDRRNRHLSEWKSQWTLKALSANDSSLSVKVLELIFVGPAENAPALPVSANIIQNSLASNTDWAETDPDILRARLELRRFWTETYPLIALPMELANVSVPSLTAAPASKDWTKRKWAPMKRPSSF